MATVFLVQPGRSSPVARKVLKDSGRKGKAPCLLLTPWHRKPPLTNPLANMNKFGPMPERLSSVTIFGHTGKTDFQSTTCSVEKVFFLPVMASFSSSAVGRTDRLQEENIDL